MVHAPRDLMYICHLFYVRLESWPLWPKVGETQGFGGKIGWEVTKNHIDSDSKINFDINLKYVLKNGEALIFVLMSCVEYNQRIWLQSVPNCSKLSTWCKGIFKCSKKVKNCAIIDHRYKFIDCNGDAAQPATEQHKEHIWFSSVDTLYC